MKIVHLIASSGMYGAEKWIFALMCAMRNTSVESILVNLSDSERCVSAVVAGAKQRNLDAVDFYTGGTFNPLAIYRFSKWLKNNDIDIVHGHGYKSDFIGCLAAKIAGCKVISTPHGWSKSNDLKLQFYEKLDRFSFRFMDYVCPLSDDLLESVNNCVVSEKKQLILNGVDIEEVDNQVPANLSYSSDYVVGYVGQLIGRKDLTTLVKSLKILIDKEIDVTLVIVGEGEDRESLEILSKNLGVSVNIDFLGYRTDSVSLMKSFDVFVLPSLLEGIPRCVMESMAAGTPVVASDIPGTRELIDHKVTGLLYEPQDEGALADALISMLSDPDRRSDLSVKARDLVAKKHSNIRMSEEYIEVYSKVLFG